MQVEEGKYFLVLHCFITPSLISHPSITEWVGGTDSLAWNQRSSRPSKWARARCERKKETEIQGIRAWEAQMLPAEVAPLLWLYSITACVFEIPVTLLLAFWLHDPRVDCQFSALPCHSPPGSHAAYTGGSGVVGRPLTSHHCCKTEHPVTD